MGKTRITVDCIDQRLIVTNDPLLASGGRNEDEIEFNFCPLWDGFGKTAVFYRTPAEAYNSSIVNNRCIIPAEVLVDKGEIFFGVFGESSGATRTSEVIKYSVVQGALLSGKKPADPTPDIYNQLMARFGEVEQRVANAVQKTGDTMTGPLTVGNNLTVKGDGWRSLSFHSSDEKYRGGVMVSADNQLSFLVKESESEYADRYTLPKPTTDKTADSWYQILTTKDPAGAREQLGVPSIAAVKNLQDHAYVEEEGQSNGWYYRKWSSGYCELSGKISVSFESKTPWGAVYYAEVPATPFPFRLTELLAGNANIQDFNTWCVCRMNSLVNTGALFAVTAAPITGTATVHYNITGLWK